MERSTEFLGVKISPKTARMVHDAFEIAKKHYHPSLLAEHIGVALYDNGYAEVFDRAFAEDGLARACLLKSAIYMSEKQSDFHGCIPVRSEVNEIFHRAAYTHAAEDGSDVVELNHVMMAITEPDSPYYWIDFQWGLYSSLTEEIKDPVGLREFLFEESSKKGDNKKNAA